MQLGDIRTLQKKRPDLITRLSDLAKKVNSIVPSHVLKQALKDTRKSIAQPFATLETLLDQVENETFTPNQQDLPMSPAEALRTYQRNPQDVEANKVLLKWGLTGAEDPYTLEDVYR